MDFFWRSEKKSSHWEENFIVHGNHNQTGKIPPSGGNDGQAMSIFTCNRLVELEDCSAGNILTSHSAGTCHFSAKDL